MYKKMNNKTGLYNDNYCSNCNITGHMYYNCKKPLLSNGIIAVKISEKDNEEHMFLMVKRKHTFGFIDFVRGKYSVNNKSHLLGMINEMTLDEKDKVMNLDFVSLRNYLWGNSKEDNQINENKTSKVLNFDNEKKHAENKLKTLKEGVYLENDNYNLKQLIESSTTTWSDPEWEFPKGRKNMGENDIECAFREFVEETGYTYNNLVLIRNLVPYEEIFIGSNYESYKNKYFVCLFDSNNAKSTKNMVLSPNETANKPINTFDKYEISEVKWFSYSECLKHIRIYNHEKKRLLSNINNTLNKYELLS